MPDVDARAALHVFPNDDVFEHDTEEAECVCGPTNVHVPDDGPWGWVVIHHSLRSEGD